MDPNLPPILPSDRYIASMLGLSDEQYAWYKAEVQRRAAAGPQPAVVAGIEAGTLAIISLALTTLSVGFTIAASFFKPKLDQPKAPGQPKSRNELDQARTENERFAPRYGFDSTQDISTLGSVVPIVYALRETIGGVTYGGVRVNTPMLWNQVLSLGGGQMLRGVFLLGEGPIASIDVNNFAIGSNTLRGYLFEDNAATQQAGRATLYFRPGGGRISGGDRVLGRANANDDGSSSSADVFQVYWQGGPKPDFCSSRNPTSQATFGVYSPIGNNLLFKVNPVIRPGVRSRVKPKTTDGRVNVQCPVDSQQMNERDKFRAEFSSFSGIIGNGTANVSVGQTITYKIFHESDWATQFKVHTKPADGEAECKDVASAVASRQHNWDDNLIIGELYKVGSALAVLTSRSNDVFVSQADLEGNGGTTITATFTVVRGGTIKGFSEGHLKDAGGDAGRREVATTGGHILRYASAIVTTNRPCQAVELNIRSTVGISINGLCNFRDAKTYQYADNAYCEAFENTDGDDIVNVFYQSSTINGPAQRYSFWKLRWRESGSNNWTTLSHAYGVRSETRQALFNYIRLEYGSIRHREFMLEPLTGYEVRNGMAGGQLYVLDAKKARLTIPENGTTVVINGEAVPLNTATFGINYGKADPGLSGTYQYEEKTNGPKPSTFRTYYGLPKTDNESHLDDFGKLAECFCYPEVNSTAETGPEHQVISINEIVPNRPVPQYNSLALIGINIRSSAEWNQFSQLSAYVTGGHPIRRLRNNLSEGPSHLFPDVLLDLMTNTVYGRGDYITDKMIDLESFKEAAQWCYDRRYFFDAVKAQRVNLRQWASDVAATHLLAFGESDGRFYLRPAFPFGAVQVKALFTAGNILEGSFQSQFLDPEEREPIQVSVRYREERASSDLANPGLFPIVREILVREGNSDSGVPTESIDLSDYCTNRQHAIDAAKFIVRMRRIPTHTIRFSTTYEGALTRLGPSDFIRVAMDITHYDQFNNGAVTADGTLISTKQLDDSTYNVIAWNGEAFTAPYDAALTVYENGTKAIPNGIVFTVKSPATQVRTYQVERITPNDDGTFTIEAVHMPTNSSNILELASGFDSSGSWIIEE